MPSSNRLNSSNRLKLGIFSSNCSSGMAVSKVEQRWENSWEKSQFVKMCDAAGIEFMLSIARWIGYGGATDFHGAYSNR